MPDMNRQKCIAFLLVNQPLPPDAELSTIVANELDAVRKWLLDHPVPEALPLLLRVFGDGDGLGIYPLIEDTIARYPREDVVAELIAVLKDSPDSTRYWALQLAAVFPSECMGLPISKLLPALDRDARYAALTALESIGGDKIMGYVSEWPKRKRNPS